MVRKRLSKEQSATGLRVALRIVSAWQATPAQACRILRISSATYRRVSVGTLAGGRLDIDQQQRIGMVIGIHATLRTVFSNQINVQSFPGMANHNPFFDGRSPLEIISQGDMISFYETYKRIEQLRFGT